MKYASMGKRNQEIKKVFYSISIIVNLKKNQLGLPDKRSPSTNVFLEAEMA